MRRGMDRAMTGTKCYMHPVKNAGPRKRYLISLKLKYNFIFKNSTPTLIYRLHGVSRLILRETIRLQDR